MLGGFSSNNFSCDSHMPLTFSLCVAPLSRTWSALFLPDQLWSYLISFGLTWGLNKAVASGLLKCTWLCAYLIQWVQISDRKKYLCIATVTILRRTVVMCSDFKATRWTALPRAINQAKMKLVYTNESCSTSMEAEATSTEAVPLWYFLHPAVKPLKALFPVLYSSLNKFESI